MKIRTVLLTGFPSSFLAVRVLRKLAQDETLRIRCLVPERFLAKAELEIGALPPERRERVDIIDGDAASMDLGLSGREFRALASEVDVIHHCAAVTYLGADRQVAEDVNVGGVREVLELAEAAEHLERVVHWSTALVSGTRRGFVLEEELSAPDGFRNDVEETRFRAERLVRRARDHVPATILRPSIIVGDSMTGEIDRFEGPYLLVMLMLSAPLDLRMPMPGRGDIALNLVPIDYVVGAGLAIAGDERSIGRAFHIVDPDPLTARRVFELIAKASGRPLPRGFLPTHLATTLLRTPGLERFANVPRSFLQQIATEVAYDDRNTREVLSGRGIECPPLESYVNVLVAHVQEQQAKRRADLTHGAEEHDPLG